MNEGKTVRSYWNVNIEVELVCQRSDTLAVLLPGIGYNVDRPLMDYSKRLVLELGYDVLPIEYGFQIARKALNPEEELKYVKEESLSIFKAYLNKNYKKIVFISKSLGTIIHSSLYNEVRDYEVKNIYLTPINDTLKFGVEKNSLVVSGTNDSLRSEKTIEELKKIPGINLVEIEDADHSLNIEGNALKSIHVVDKVIKAEKEYLEEIIY